MPSLLALSPQAFAGKRWQRYADYRFAVADACCPLVAQEISVAALAFPVAFVQEGERFWPVAVQGLLPGKNLLVHPDGHWLGAYIPAFYRGHPFCLIDTPAGESIVCVDVDSPLLSDSEGELLFEVDGRLGKGVAAVVDFFHKIAANRRLTVEICGLLQHYELFEPWGLTLKMPSGEQVVQGLFRINEARLSGLDGDALQALMRLGALGVVYCHLSSLQQLPVLSRLVDLHAAATSAQAQLARADLNLDFLNQSGTISFAGI